jgi:hypothetical protein
MFGRPEAFLLEGGGFGATTTPLTQSVPFREGPTVENVEQMPSVPSSAKFQLTQLNVAKQSEQQAAGLLTDLVTAIVLLRLA